MKLVPNPPPNLRCPITFENRWVLDEYSVEVAKRPEPDEYIHYDKNIHVYMNRLLYDSKTMQTNQLLTLGSYS